MSRNIRSLALFCLTLLLYFSCNVLTKKKKTPITESDKSTEQTEVKKNSKKESKPLPYHASEPMLNDLLHTKLEVSFDWQKRYLNGTATLTFKPYFYPQKTLLLDAKGMDISSVKMLKPFEKDLAYTYDKKVINIDLGKTFTNTDTFIVKVKYTAKPDELPKGGSDAIKEDKGLYFINPDNSDPHKPQQIWTQGETEASSCWFPTIDQPNERTTQEMFITIDTGFTVLSNGEFIYSKENGNGTKTDHWRMEYPHAPYLFMMAIGKFAVVKDKWKDMEVNYYVEPYYAPYAKDIFGNTPEMIGFFSDKLKVKYPWSKYSQVVVRDYVSGAMENTTATIFMENLQVDDRALQDENWETIIAHELFHHWFGDYVTCESWSNLPLNESFANYSEYLWLEYKHGLDEADMHGEEEADQYFEEAKGKQAPLIRYHYADKEDMFDRHSYNKGGRILHMLRKEIGDSAFFESLSLYLKRNKFTSVEVHDLRLAFEDVTGLDLNWFFDQWFMASGHPVLNVKHSYSPGSSKLEVVIEQMQDTMTTPVYRIPMDLDVWVNGTKTTHRIILENKKQEFKIPVSGQPTLVVIDPNHDILAEITHTKEEQELVKQFRNYKRYLAKKDALKELFTSRQKVNQGINPQFEKTSVKEILNEALNDPFWGIREMALEQFTEFAIPEFEKYLPAIEKIASEDPKPTVRARAIYLLSGLDNDKYIEIYKKGMKEKSYAVAGASLSSYLKTDQPDKLERVKEFEKYDNLNITLALAEFYLQQKDLTKYPWFKQKIQTGSDQQIYNMINAFGQYAMLLDEEQKEDAKKVLKDISENNHYEVIRTWAGFYLKLIK